MYTLILISTIFNTYIDTEKNNHYYINYKAYDLWVMIILRFHLLLLRTYINTSYYSNIYNPIIKYKVKNKLKVLTNFLIYGTIINFSLVITH